ncbi:hypothetical protein U9M48_005390 [Paspalum notatum var. saurae]|uniref:Glutamate-rich WD repeat-containing protein 1 n=1 Tax=Paspalum notatum var. saurae TaxID=547442 RepID=A0AAQ3SFF9_PASNO
MRRTIKKARKAKAKKTKVWQPGVDALEDGEELQFDPQAYNSKGSALAVSMLPATNLGSSGQSSPIWSMAEKPQCNYIGVFKLSNISSKKREPIPASAVDGDNDVDSDSSSDEEAESGIPAPNEDDIIHKHTPVKVFSGHKDEGYAIDWSLLVAGRLVSGDCKKCIHLWEPTSNNWNVDSNPFVGHSASVEDLQWSPTEADLFASCSVDDTIAIWDIRKGKKPCISVKAHKADVNVISWNRLASCMIASGCDDGSFSVSDLRLIEKDPLVAHFEYHKKAIISIEWNPHEASSLANLDLSLERDAEEEAEFRAKMKDQPNTPENLPPQLLFVHQGQRDLKELHWHPRLPSMIISTAIDGFNVLMPSNIDTTIPGNTDIAMTSAEP